MPITENKLVKVKDIEFDLSKVSFSKPELEDKMINGKKSKKMKAEIKYDNSDKNPIIILNNVYTKRGMQDYQDDKKFNMKFKISGTVMEEKLKDLQEKFVDYLQKYSTIIFNKKDYSKPAQRGIITGMLDSYTILKKNSDDEGNLYLKAKLPADYTIKTPDFYLLQESEESKTNINLIELYELDYIFKLDSNGRPVYNAETKRREYSKEWNSCSDEIKNEFVNTTWVKAKSILRYDSTYTVGIIPEIYFLPAGGAGISFKINVIQAPFNAFTKKPANNSVFSLNDNSTISVKKYSDLNKYSTETTSNAKISKSDEKESLSDDVDIEEEEEEEDDDDDEEEEEA
jgi:hypothetical protein